MIDLTQYKPQCADDMIGKSARRWATVLEKRVERMKASQDGTLKALLLGDPGTGKTTIANFIASQLCDSPFAITETNGADISVDLVRKMGCEFKTSSLFSAFRVWIINEIDTMNNVAQTSMLSLLDSLPTRHAVIGTSNLDTNQLIERFQTRFQQMTVKKPEPPEVIEGLSEEEDTIVISALNHQTLRPLIQELESRFRPPKSA